MSKYLSISDYLLEYGSTKKWNENLNFEAVVVLA